VVAFVAGVAVVVHAQTIKQPARSVTDPGVVTTRQAITPAGVQSVFEGRVYGVTFGASADEVWVVAGRPKTQLYRLDWKQNSVRDRWELEGTAALQGLAFDAVRKMPLMGLTAPARGADGKPMAGGSVRLLAHDGKAYAPFASDLGKYLAGGPAIAPAGAAARRAVMPLIFDNELAIINAESGAVEGKVKTQGVAPFGAVIGRDGRSAWVTNWGGRWPRNGDATLPTGMEPAADRVVVDARGIASTGTLVRIDLDGRRVTHTVDVGLHPTAIAWDETRHRLYVANANSDTISVIDTSAVAAGDQKPVVHRVAATIPIRPFGLTLGGVAPSALAVSSDGATLYAALGGFNAIAVIDPRQTGPAALRGLIPTAWYPSHLAISGDGSSLAVATLLGVGSGYQDDPKKRYVHAYRGTVSVLPIPDAAQLASFTTAVAENNHIDTARAQLAAAGDRKAIEPLPVPRRAGDPSLIEHVVYIVKENRTYDQLFGDLPRGNGEPSFVMFGEDVTPNQRRLATDFVLLDNFYAAGGNSGDGHQWVTQANETSYALWPGYQGRSYPFDGTDPIAYANTGFIWDLAMARGRTVKVYGEYAGRLPTTDRAERQNLLDRWKAGDTFATHWNITAPLAPLNRILAKNYPSYTTGVPDVVRARIFLKDLDDWNRSGTMPNLVILQLPSDHTSGVSPDYSTPKAMVADNDLAVGQIVEALTATPFWKKMAIFVVEDDAQAGVDHVDGHRTVALAVSPYTRRGHVDSTFYAHPSMVKTIELMLGLPTMSLFDLIATDMRASFTTTADYTPFKAITPAQSLFERTPVLSAMRGPERQAALASLRMRFDVPDAAPTERLNRIVWGHVRGWHVPYPKVVEGIFAPLGIDMDDEEREEAEERAERGEREGKR
jgi:DNA-binding beta-propeller fold protein YncE